MEKTVVLPGWSPMVRCYMAWSVVAADLLTAFGQRGVQATAERHVSHMSCPQLIRAQHERRVASSRAVNLADTGINHSGWTNKFKASLSSQ